MDGVGGGERVLDKSVLWDVGQGPYALSASVSTFIR